VRGGRKEERKEGGKGKGREKGEGEGEGKRSYWYFFFLTLSPGFVQIYYDNYHDNDQWRIY